MDKTKDFDKWMAEGLEKGYIQELDRQFRLQHSIQSTTDPKHWEEVKEHFREK